MEPEKGVGSLISLEKSYLITRDVTARPSKIKLSLFFFYSERKASSPLFPNSHGSTTHFHSLPKCIANAFLTSKIICQTHPTLSPNISDCGLLKYSPILEIQQKDELRFLLLELEAALDHCPRLSPLSNFKPFLPLHEQASSVHHQLTRENRTAVTCGCVFLLINENNVAGRLISMEAGKK